MMQKQVTQQDPATLYARAWNQLEPDAFLALVVPDTRYASQWVFEELANAPAIGQYLRKKMQAVRDSSATDPASGVRAELGRTANGKACVLIAQGPEVRTVVVFKTEGSQIKRFDTCIPELMRPRGSGEFPV